MDIDQDRIARDAARRLHDQAESTMRAAIAAARSAAGGDDAAVPSRGRVRRHLMAMQQQSMGVEAWSVARHSMLRAVEECMAGLHWALEDLELRLTGRAAEGHVDGVEPVSMRMHSTVDHAGFCAVLEEQEFAVAEPGTLETRHGRMTRITAEAAEFDLIVLRCHHRSQVTDPRNLVDGSAVTLLDVDEFGRRFVYGVSDPGAEPASETG